ncbi:hypothetical protein AB0I93_27005 [Streptomyces sp. NPDC049967]|uniref:hypothetical protein n=1 Tax=Streptomyces sp. NPDC049967 TaxID=3155658 RepID=UPI0034219B13
MTARRTTTAVVSELLTELPDAPTATRALVAPQLLRALGLTKEQRDYEDTVAAGYVESPDEFAVRIGGGSR